MALDRDSAGGPPSARGVAGTDNEFRPPNINLPKGGGAIRGIGEKFAANPVTGTGSMSVPIALSPGRSGFGPQLSLSYDSGAGNGAFGFGWSLSIPSITRKTDKGLPQYQDAEESDVYVLSGAEDLVPVLQPDGTRFKDQTTVPGYVIHRYRPRVEGLFARIERWTEVATGEIQWRSITRDNVTTRYGKDNSSRIFDPADPDPNHPTRIFSWLICESYDDKGNAIIYDYAAENDDNVDRSQANERNRTRTANRYVKRIRYGNREPNRDAVTWQATDPSQLPKDTWMFEVVFDYGDAHYEELELDPARPEAEQHRFVLASALPELEWNAEGRGWDTRPDPFSLYRAGFEVRTYRRCRRVLMFHHIPDLPTGEKGYDGLVRATEFDYSDLDYTTPVAIETELAYQGSTRLASFIRAVTQSGYVRDDEQPVVVRNGVQYVTYLKKSLPPLEFEYSKAAIQQKVCEVDAVSLENLPAGIDGSTYQWVDLDGEGVSGVLTEQAGAWLYKPSLGGGHFGPAQTVAAKPSLAALSGGHQQLLDLAGDGQLDLVSFGGPTPGYYERTFDENWTPFCAFRQLPQISWDDPNLRFVDLNGDGHADVLITEQDVFTWHPSLAEEGFGAAQKVRQAWDEERGPRLLFADGTQSIYLADMSGDGLSDLVRIRNGEVCYWPNLGYGRFGPKVTIDNAPWFDHPDQFEQRRVRLADIDGSGTSDVIYLARDGVRLYFNQSGNRLSEARLLALFPPVDKACSFMTADLLGNGTACLVWSSPLPANAGRNVRYVDLMGGIKPHLLVKSVNNLGAETEVQYAPSTWFYLDDKRNGRPWVTHLPFPVHVVERIVTRDQISGNLFVTRYAYHHGYFDGIEREFRGFGLVEQWDTEELAALNAGERPVGTNIDESSDVPPVLTKTWFHTGVYDETEEVSQHFAAEYYGAPAKNDPNYQSDFDAFFKTLLPDTVLPDDLTVEEEREACRALKGSMLRQEVYALDNTDKQKHPYTVTEQNFTIRTVQQRGENRHAVFFTHARESISYHYEREPSDPRVGHALTVEVDRFGNVLKSAAIGYGRKQPDLNLSPADQAKQAQILITYTENSVTSDHDTGSDAIDRDNDYRTPLPCESLTYELTGVDLAAGRDRFTFDELLDAGTTAIAIDYDTNPTAGRREKRLIEHVRTYYRRDDLAGPLPLGELQPLALPFESYKRAFTPGLIAKVYGGRATDALLGDEGRYVHSEGDANWWIPSGKLFYSPNPADTPTQEMTHARQHFFLPHRYRDPFHTDAVSTESFVTYDTYDLLVQETRDALGNRVTVGERNVDPTQPPVLLRQDYRVLQPGLVMDPNRNRSEVAFDALGMVVGTVVMGKPAPASVEGDSLNGFRADLTQTEIDQFLADPKGPMAATLLDDATTRVVYDLTAWWSEPVPAKKPPAVAATLARETHVSDLQGQQTKIQVSLSYSDGFGREIQEKIQAERGPVPMRDAAGKIIVGPDGQPQMTPYDVSPRWVGSGWTIFNNKGKPVRQYEPFFTDTHRFEFDVKIGVSPVLFYDPVERVVATLHPNHTWEKVVFDPWRRETWDVNDTVLITDPKTDADVGDFFGRLSNAEYLPTWHALRTDAAHAPAFAARYPDATDRTSDTRAAEKTRVHAATPTVAHADSLGRTFLTAAHNKAKYSDTPAAAPPVEEFHTTRIILDIEGNQREVIDAKDRVVMRYAYDMLGNRVHQASMEAGERWMLNDVAGKSLYAWDSRDHRFRIAYDPLRRPTDSYLSVGGSAEMVVGQTLYGERHPNYPIPETTNVRGKVVELRDQAGVVTSGDYDFKGNLLHSERQLAQSYKTTLDWSGAVVLQPETYTSRARYDALNRPTQLIAPHGDQPGTMVNVIQPSYNDANLLEQVHAWLNRNAEPAGLLDPTTANLQAVTDIDYDAKGQRTIIDRGTQDGKVIRTSYVYDHETFRLTHLYTRRGVDPLSGQGVTFTADCDNPQPPPPTIAAPEAPPQGRSCGLQNLHYTYDPAGNITDIRDDAQQTIYFRNQRVEPSADYTYDAVYRLIESTGRQHLGQIGGAPIPHSYDDVPRVGWLHPGDGNAMGRYLERYVYDAVGNFLSMQHRGTDPANPGWSRAYTFGEPSSLEPGKQSNRLTSTTIGGTTETYSAAGDGYDAHGSMLRMPHLQVMQWDFRDQLQMTQRQAVNAADADGVRHQGERTWYVYDSAGQRVWKVTESAAGQVKDERIYLGGFEIYRKNGGSSLVRETLHIMDDRQHVALVETRTRENEPGVLQQIVRYQFANHLGSASLEMDDQAQIISYEEYTPYGSTSYEAVRSQTETPNHYRFTGKERDEESGLYYHGARYYAPWLERWINCDPIGLSGGIDLFCYARGNPAIYVDPSGHQPKPKARLGDVNRHADQGLRGKGTPGALESEHLDPIAVQREYLRNPGTGQSPIPKGRGSPIDRAQPTVMLKKATADAKTRLDRLVISRVKAGAAAAGELGAEAGLARTSAAAARTGTPVPVGVYAAAIGQIDALHADPAVRAFSRNPVNNPLIGASDAEISAAIDGPLNAGAQRAGSLTSLPATKDANAKTLFKGNYSEPVSSGSAALRTGGKAFGVGALLGTAGYVATQLYEGRKADAAETAGVTVAATWVISKVPALIPLAIMKSTIDAYDENVERHAFSAGEFVERKTARVFGETGSRIAGATTSAVAATGESLFEGTFGVVGRGIGGGAAAIYLWATGN
jgi:RHS repeat-associated protein